jgi:hypothetical protein
MIRYDKHLWGIAALFRFYGSAFPRALPFSLASALAAALLKHFVPEKVSNEWQHPYPYSTFAFIVGFMVVFRHVSLRTQ